MRISKKRFFCLAIILSFNFITIFCSREKVISPENEQVKSIVDYFGNLQVNGNKIVDQRGDPVALHGMSLFWSQWIGKYYNYECIKWLRDDWNCSVIRAALGVDEQDGYLTKPQVEGPKIRTAIDACIDLGIYVIVDWHSHHAEDYPDEAAAFFKQIATLYGDKPNIIYEIYNEPLQVSWNDVIKPYAQKVIEAIRSEDPDNIIIVGTPNWSQDVYIAASNPLEFTNIAYALHFYAGTHKKSLREKSIAALDKGVAIFVSEWGTSYADASGPVFYDETREWIAFTDDHGLSWCNWSVADKNETTSVLKSNASEKGGWSLNDLTESGKFVRSLIIERNESFFRSLGN